MTERYDLTLTASGTTPPMPMNSRAAPFTVGLCVEVAATSVLTYKVQHTFWPLSALEPMSGSVVWFDHPTLSGAASLNSNYAFNVTAIRLNVPTFTSGAAVIRTIQGTLSA